MLDTEKLIYKGLYEENPHAMRDLGFDGAMTSSAFVPGRLSIVDAKWVAVWILEALDYLHSRGISFQPKAKDIYIDIDQHGLVYKRLRVRRIVNAEENLATNCEIAAAMQIVKNLIAKNELDKRENNSFRITLENACKGRYAAARAVIRDFKQ